MTHPATLPTFATPKVVWRKSSRSANAGGQCVEAGVFSCHGIAIRDSKHVATPPLAVTHADWTALIASVKMQESLRVDFAFPLRSQQLGVRSKVIESFAYLRLLVRNLRDYLHLRTVRLFRSDLVEEVLLTARRTY